MAAVQGVESATKRPKGGAFFARYGGEFCLAGFLVLTAAVIGFQHQIFGRDIEITDKTAGNYPFSGYSDLVTGGRSTITLSSSPLAWSCDLKPNARWLFCGHDIGLDANGAKRGADLRGLEAVTLTIDYHGPATTLRLSLKNEDPRYSRRGDISTDKVNKVEFSVRDGVQTLVFRRDDFGVADYWLAGRNLPPELARTQLDDVVSADISTGSNPVPGHYSFRIKSLSFARSTVSGAQLYLGIIAVWGVLIGFYVLVRVSRARRRALARALAETEARAALADARDAAELASKAKSEFLARMSHELRTPLNAVLGYAQLLERAGLAEDHHGAARAIHRSGRHLLSLISDILDLSKIEAGKMELNRAPMDVRGAVGSVAEMVRVRAEEKGLVFTCVVGDDVPEAIGADEKKLRQILLNLLSNAVKFTSHGTVSLLVKLVERGDEAATLRFEVHDSGPGIAEGELERIFHPFEQGGEVRYREGGTGLGLTISRQLAAVMGAAIEVRSRPGQGTTFWFEASFPHAERAAGDTVDGSAHIVGYAGRRRRVLVVDDHEANCDLLCGLLRQLGFETDVAHDGGEAVALAQRVGPDLVLMDLNMPVVDGHEAIRRMRSTDSLKATPIVAVSATHAEDGEASSRAAGADDFIAKPVDNGVLLAAIGRLLELEWTGAVPSAERRTAEADRPLRILAAEDNVTNQLILRALLGNLNADLQVVPNGVEAVGAFRDHSFDVVLMDVQMPGMSGVEATRVIREFEAQTGRPRTPIIALSADVMAEQIEAFQAAGMDTHVAKPIEIEQLYGVLAQVSAGGFRNVPLADAPGRSRQTG